jgi:hypothetical protein
MKKIEFWIPILISIVITPFCLLLALGSAGAGHGDYFLIKIFFPYTMISTIYLNSITLPFIILGIIQFPLYGIIIAIAIKKWKLFTSLILAFHILSVFFCLNFVGSAFS